MPNPVIIQGVAPTKVLGRGRPLGSGCNCRLIKKLVPGSPNGIWELTYKKMRSIVVSADRMGVKLKVRKQPQEGEQGPRYAIWRV